MCMVNALRVRNIAISAIRAGLVNYAIYRLMTSRISTIKTVSRVVSYRDASSKNIRKMARRWCVMTDPVEQTPRRTYPRPKKTSVKIRTADMIAITTISAITIIINSRVQLIQSISETKRYYNNSNNRNGCRI